MSCRSNLLNIQPPTLPFLFETKTLRPRPFQKPQNRPFPKPSRRHLSTTNCSLAELEDRNIGSNEPPEPSRLHYYPPRPTNSRSDSTITASEQAVFDRIFADILSSKSSDPVRSLKVEPEQEDELFADLDTLFNDAIDQLEKRTERIEQRRAALGITPSDTTTVWSPVTEGLIRRVFYDFSHSDYGWDQPGKIGSDDVSNLASAHAEYRMKVDHMLGNAQTDIEIWQILENEVFSLVHELNARIKKAEKSNKKSKSQKATKSQTEVTSSSSPPPSSEGKQEETQKSAAGKTTAIRQPLPSTSLPPTVLLSILQTEYPKYLYQALRILRKSFPGSTFALHALPTVRRLGPISHVLGASTALYNETLLVMWSQEGDLNAMADLLDEMRKLGVESDQVTLALLTGLGKTRTAELAGKNGKWRKMWWSTASGQEGWQRVEQRLERCREEVTAKDMELFRQEKELDDLEQGQSEQKPLTG